MRMQGTQPSQDRRNSGIVNKETLKAPKGTVLVVDDSAANRYSLARAVRAGGFEALESAGGAQALELAGSGRVAAILLDVHLPDLHGFEVCRLLRGNPATARIPVIHVSSVYVAGADQAAGMSAGADAYMLNPVDPQVLVATLDALVQGSVQDNTLRESEARFRGAFEKASCGLAIVDARGFLLEVNEELARILERLPERACGLQLADFVERESRQFVQAVVKGWAHAPWQGRLAMATPGGGRVQVLWSAMPHSTPGLAVATALAVPGAEPS